MKTPTYSWLIYFENGMFTQVDATSTIAAVKKGLIIYNAYLQDKIGIHGKARKADIIGLEREPHWIECETCHNRAITWDTKRLIRY